MRTSVKDKVWKNRKKPFRKWIWKCPFPDCNAQGKKVQTHCKAQYFGLAHLKKFHKKEFYGDDGRRKIYPILEIVTKP